MTNYLDDEYESTPSRPSGSNKTFLVVGIVGGLGLLAVLLCCGGGLAVFYFGSGVLQEEIRNELKGNPVIAEHIGNIQECDIDWTKSGAAHGDDDFVLRIVGDKGSGYVTVTSITNFEGDEEVVDGTLEMDNGDTFELFPDEEIVDEESGAE